MVFTLLTINVRWHRHEPVVILRTTIESGSNDSFFVHLELFCGGILGNNIYLSSTRSGAGVFLTTIVVGSIAVAMPFKSMERPFLRDIIFYMVTTYFTFYIFYDGSVNIYEASGLFFCWLWKDSRSWGCSFVQFLAGFIIGYAVYVAVVLLGRVINQKLKKSRLSVHSGLYIVIVIIKVINFTEHDYQGIAFSCYIKIRTSYRSYNLVLKFTWCAVNALTVIGSETGC